MPDIRLLVLVLLTLVSACGQGQRSTATLPAVEVRGAESSSFSLYATTSGRGTTALGQIFAAPEGHDFLTNAGFLCRHGAGPGRASDMRVRLRISPWQGDRPGSVALWESEPVELKKDFRSGWLTFDLPHVKLAPNRSYLAWLSLAGLDNADDASFGVVGMGARTRGPQPKPGQQWQPDAWSTPYPEGTRAFFRQSNPDARVEPMTQSAWEVEQSGQNLHFKMTFVNRGP